MRNKKQPVPEPSPEQVAVERHVEALMNPRQPDDGGAVSIAVNKTPANAPLDIFKAMTPNSGSSMSIIAAKTAPEMPGKSSKKPLEAMQPIEAITPAPTKSLFSSVKVLTRSRDEAVPVAVTPKLVQKPSAPLAKPLSTPKPALSPEPPKKPSVPIAISTAPLPVDLAAPAAVNVEKLARREEYADAATDSAVADIVAKEGDQLLAIEDKARAQKSGPVFKKPRRGAKLRRFFTSKWLLLLIPIILIALVALPYSRYKLAGLFIKKTLSVMVIDSKTSKPVSGALVSFNDQSAKTNAAGQASLIVPVGTGQLSITKSYYQSYNLKETLGVGSTVPATRVNLVATGRQVPITIVNKLTNKPVVGVTVKVLGTSAISDANGKLTIVLPTRAPSVTATLSAPGYNETSASIEVTDSVVPSNSLSLVPAGALYFLSNSSGSIDVVKTNLDGSGQHVVFAGTGKEDAATTSLVASRDWRYAVLRTRRDGSQNALYLIDTSTDKATQFDSAPSTTYTSIGWSNHSFVYDAVRTAQTQSQAGRESIKSYNAEQLQLNQLDQSQAVGTSASFAYQAFNNFFMLDNLVVYNTQWTPGSTSGSPYDLSSQSDTIRTVTASGQSKKDVQSYAAADIGYVQTAHVTPATIDYGVYNNKTTQTTYYSYSNNSVTSDATVTADTFKKTYPIYLPSPDGIKSFWNDQVKTKQALLVGDKSAANPVTIASAGEYTAYGWYTADYLLLSRAGSGLYIVPSSGISSNGGPLKIGDYYQPVAAPTSYGGGF
jgi:hypothetical protein